MATHAYHHVKQHLQTPVRDFKIYQSTQRQQTLQTLHNSKKRPLQASGFLFLKEKALATALTLELPTEILAQQAKEYGYEFLKYLPDSHPQYIEFAELAIQKDGFKSLKKVPLKYIKADVTLLYKALDKDGSQKFEDYMLEFLDPHKSSGYMCHNEWHDYQYFDKTCVELQRAILDNCLFWTTLSCSKHAETLRPNFRKSLELAVKAGEAYIAYENLSAQAHAEKTK